MKISELHHFTLRCQISEMEALKDFYVRLLDLVVGKRPDFDFPGYWLYLADRPIVHIAALAESLEPARTGRFDHIAFRAAGLAQTRQLLKARHIAFEEAPVPGFPLYQLFVVDPIGLKVELTFDESELTDINEQSN